MVRLLNGEEAPVTQNTTAIHDSVSSLERFLKIFWAQTSGALAKTPFGMPASRFGVLGLKSRLPFCHRRQQVVAHVYGSLPLIRENHTGFLTPDFDLANAGI